MRSEVVVVELRPSLDVRLSMDGASQRSKGKSQKEGVGLRPDLFDLILFT